MTYAQTHLYAEIQIQGPPLLSASSTSDREASDNGLPSSLATSSSARPMNGDVLHSFLRGGSQSGSKLTFPSAWSFCPNGKDSLRFLARESLARRFEASTKCTLKFVDVLRAESSLLETLRNEPINFMVHFVRRDVETGLLRACADTHLR
jgi:hypothetical protein